MQMCYIIIKERDNNPKEKEIKTMMEMVFAVGMVVVIGGFVAWFVAKEVKEMVELNQYMKKVFR
jgi:uncharacterized membrane protein